MEEEKIKEIEAELLGWIYKYIPRGKTIPIFEDKFAELKRLVRQQTLEEVIASLPEEAIKWMYEGNKNKDKKSAESFNSCRQQTLSNLQALKDKNYDK